MPFRRTYAREDVVDRGGRVSSDDPVVVQDDAYEAVDDRPGMAVAAPPFSPAQLIALIAGLGFIVLGIAAVAQTGFDTDHIYTPQQKVWGLWHSPLLGLIEIGLVIFVDSARDDLHGWFGVTTGSGWFFTIVGAVTLLAALASPVFFPTTRRQHVRARRVRSTA